MRKFLPLLLSGLILLSGCSIIGGKPKPATTAEPQQTESTEAPVEDQQDPDAEEPEETAKPNQTVQIDYDPTLVPDSDKLGQKIEKSYYYNHLNASQKELYEEIIRSVKAWEAEVTITESSLEDVIRVMNIIMIDDPDAYQLDTTYNYSTSEDTGLVNHLFLRYIMTYDDYMEIEKSYLSVIRGYEEMRDKDTTQIKALEGMIRTISGAIIFEESEKYEAANTISLLAGVNKGYTSNFVIARAMNSLCHHAGIPSLVAISVEGIAKLADLSRVTSLDTENKEISLNYPEFHWFNEICLNNNWYISDVYNQRIFNDVNNLSLGTISLDKPSSFYLITNDERYAGTHTWWITDVTLGELPACQELDFIGAYRSGSFVPMPSEKNPSYDYLVNYVLLFQQKVIEDVVSKKEKSFVLVFENKDLYDIFKDTFRATTKSYDYKGRHVEDYDATELDEYYILYLKDFYAY